MITAPRRIALAALGIAMLTVVLVVLSPLRQLSADSTPGRIGGAVLRCNHSFDLAHVDWVEAMAARKHVYYWFLPDDAGEWTSVFGPAPAVIGAIAVADFGSGDTISDDSLRRRERVAAALLVALAAALLVIAVAARSTVTAAAIAGALAVLSFAGAASLGQGLYQATAALPFVTGALATEAWRMRRPALRFATPALLAVAVMLRPTIAPLVLGIGLAWAVRTRRDRRTWLVAAGIAIIAIAPLVAWNVVHLASPLPLGQWQANSLETGDVFSIGGALTGIAGLLVSPARGLLWFAPIALVGIVAGLRRERELQLVAAGCLLQLVAMAVFFKWHGGQAFGPRLLAEMVWVSSYLGCVPDPRRVVAAIAIAVTVVLGQLSLWRYDPDQWETRRHPQANPDAFWDVADSPIAAAILAEPIDPRAHTNDSDPRRTWTCTDRGLRTR